MRMFAHRLLRPLHGLHMHGPCPLARAGPKILLFARAAHARLTERAAEALHLALTLMALIPACWQ